MKKAAAPSASLLTPAKAGPTRRAKAPRTRPNLREEQKLFTRERLIKCALEVFRRVGYRAATVDQITTLAGANRATFYLHYRDKLDLTKDLARRFTVPNAHRFAHLDTEKTPSLAAVRQWLDDYIDQHTDPLLGRILVEATASDPEFAKEQLDYMGRVADQMSQYLARWSGMRRDIARAKVVLVEMMLGRYLTRVFAQGLDFPGNYEREALAEAIWAILFCDCGAAQE